MMIKAVFFDVDGTLISHKNNVVPESTRIALNLLEKRGIKRIISTGRHMIELEELPVNNIEFDAYITLNGQLCLDSQRNIILENPIDGFEKECLIKLFKEKTIPIMLVEKDSMYINYIDRQVEIAQQAISTPVPEVKEYTGNEIYQVIAFIEAGEEDLLCQKLTNCKITRWNDYAVDIIAATGGKTAGVKAYLKANNLEKEETMAFGDGDNDIEMLKYVQIGVAMGNAGCEVKVNADYITDSVDNDGIMKALISLNICEKPDRDGV